MMQSLWHIDANSSTIKTEDSIPSSQNIFVHALYSMISTGTEKLVSTGKVPVNCFEKMAVPYMEGDFSFPIKYGYALVGKLEDGRLVQLLHPHQNFCSVSLKDIYMVPESLPPQRATLISNMETIINAYWDSGVVAGDKIVVLGFGNIGALLSVTLSELGAKPSLVVEPNEWRAERAKKMGFNVVSSLDSSEKFQYAFNTTANVAALNTAIACLEMEGKVVELSWYGDQKLSVDLGSHFHYNRISIISSQVGVIPKKMQAQYDYKTRKDYVVELLKNDVYDQLITHIIPFKNSPDFFHRLRNNQLEDGLIWLIKY